MRALAGAIVVSVFACHRAPPDGGTQATASATPSASGSAEPFTMSSVPQSSWSPKSSEPLELVVAPDRAALLTYEGMNGGYVLHRGEESRRLPREWFGAGPPRRDVSISADGARIAIPADPVGDERAAVTVYDTSARRFLARLAVPRSRSPDGGDVVGKLSADGKSVVWTSSRRPCMVTDLDTKTLDADAAKHGKCGK